MDKKHLRCKGFFMMVLEDGSYDVMVIEADERPDGSVAVELAVASGPHRGEVVRIVATNLGRSWIELLAAPGTLAVTDGNPVLSLDD
jgi:hypothetical protein